MRSPMKCRAVNYDVNTTNCYLMSTAMADVEANIVQDESFDYYEPACFTETHDEVTQILSADDIFLLHERNRTLRQEYRNIQHWKIDDLTTCWLLCCNATKFICRAFSYSESMRECMLSSSKVGIAQDYEKFTQKSSAFNLYVRHGHGSAGYDHATTKSPPHTTQAPFPTLVHDSALKQAISKNALEEPVFSFSNSLFVTETSVRRTSPRPPTKATTSSFKGLVPSLDPELQQLTDSESIPRLTALSEHVGYVPPEGVKKYTGAIYAAERFEQCRVFVRSSSRFAIFIPRPQHNTWCNALEISHYYVRTRNSITQDNIVSAVIVMSNDRVLPHDVTTKDDLFFHVTCNYTATTVNEVRQGIVVG
ncbi:PAN domain protein [Cooperia oncophora]